MTTPEVPRNQKNTVLVTGACGFIGSHLCEHYLKAGFNVIGVDNFCTALASNLNFLKNLPQSGKNFFFVEADISLPWTFIHELPADWQKSLSYVFHFASPASPPLYQKLALQTMAANTQGLQHAIDFADQNNGRVIFASTSEIYGDPLVHPQVETYWGNVNTLGPRSCYDESKRFGETLIYTHNLVKKTHHGLVRIFNTYGPRMNPTDGRVIINFLFQAMKGEELTIYGDGKQTRSFCYIDDLIQGITQYAKNSTLTEVVNLGNPLEQSIFSLAETICKIFPNIKVSTQKIPLPENDPARRKPDITRAKTLLNWNAQIPLELGLRKMIDWLSTQTDEIKC